MKRRAPATGGAFILLSLGTATVGGTLGVSTFVVASDIATDREIQQAQEALVLSVTEAQSDLPDTSAEHSTSTTSTTAPIESTPPVKDELKPGVGASQGTPGSPESTDSGETVATTSTTLVPPEAVTTTTAPPVAVTEPIAEQPADSTLPIGSPLGVIDVPQIGLSYAVVHGDGKEQLRVAIGHMPGTPLPGELGNSVLAGHRTSNGAPLYDLDLLAVGDRFTFRTGTYTLTYEVTGSEIIDPSNVQAVWTKDWSRASLTLYSCTPRGSTQARLLVHANLIDDTRDSTEGDADA